MAITPTRYWLVRCRADGCHEAFRQPHDPEPWPLETPEDVDDDLADELCEWGWSVDRHGALRCFRHSDVAKTNASRVHSLDALRAGLTAVDCFVAACDADDCGLHARRLDYGDGCSWPAWVNGPHPSQWYIDSLTQHSGWHLDADGAMRCTRCRLDTGQRQDPCGHLVTRLCPVCVQCVECDVGGYCECDDSPLYRQSPPPDHPTLF